MDIKPSRYISGSAFNGNRIQGNRAISHLANRNQTNYVSLTEWCEKNFITKRVGYSLIQKRLLISQRLHGQWWVTSNPECLEQLLEHLEVDQLTFDANNLTLL